MSLRAPSIAIEPPELAGASANSVLIADDDRISRLVLERQLQDWGCHVVAVENGSQAWTALQQVGAPRMAILDWMMPGIDGVELCRQLRKLDHGPYFYLLLRTGRDNQDDIVTGLEAGADDYLTKPFHGDELRARVRTGMRILGLQDVLIKTQDALKFEAAHDRLTGVWNRGAIVDLLARESLRSVRTGDPLGVIMVDVDHFKKVNDTHGHLVGDAVLQEVARRLLESVRSYDYVGRYGGEEFLAVLAECEPAAMVATGERMRLAIAARPIVAAETTISVTISLGLASLPAERCGPLDLTGLLQAADTALYAAKNHGRNRIEAAPFAYIV